jgi:predicted ATPase/GAF domain-containing protein
MTQWLLPDNSMHESLMPSLGYLVITVLIRESLRYSPQLMLIWFPSTRMPLPTLPTPDLSPEISGYTLVDQLYLGSSTAVYQAIHNAQQRKVVIKVLRKTCPSFSELLQFRNQYTILQELANANIQQIAKPVSMEAIGRSDVLVMDYCDGITLGTYLQQQQKLELTEVLTIALQLTDILQNLYQHRVIHKDIKPANILIHPASKRITLIDFSIASLLPKETQEIQSPNRLEGTLAYLAPEQTGRMNRTIDYRTDFYAFGITLYQLLTGVLPFVSDDPLELVHCHIAKVAIPIDRINPHVPTMVSSIIAKLMAKNAEDRYQSARGLQYDLSQCLTQWTETGAITPFDLGERDLSDRFLIPEKLYGRETEVQALLDGFDRVADGSSELILVAGFSGIGKTAIVNEVHKPIARQRGYFIKGKFDQFNRNIPLSAFVQAFRNLMEQLLSESDQQLQIWQSKILAALGDNAQVLIEVIPELSNVIGEQPPAAKLFGSAAQARFNTLFQKFIQVFTTAQHPLVMFLDDLQWADAASLNLMQLLIGESQTGYLLLIGAYRDHEVSLSHPLMLVLEAIQDSGAIVRTMTIEPLSTLSLNQLVADTLACTIALAKPLTQLIAQKTQGNPFFTTQFLKVLHQDGLMTFNARTGYWQCDITQIQAAALTDDVVTFMSQQLKKLPSNTQRILKLAACIGNQFDLNTVSIVSEQTESDTAAMLWQALEDGLIVPQSKVYKFYGVEPQSIQDHGELVMYRFLHDRIQQAAYALIPNTEKQATHLKIGQLLLQKIPDSTLKQSIFEVVNQMNIGINLIENLSDLKQLATLNLWAGQKAKLATAYTDAAQYFDRSRSLLPPDSWQTDYDLTLAIYIEAAETDYLNSNFLSLENLSQIVLQQAKTILDRVKIYELKIQAYQTQSLMLRAIETGLVALQDLEIQLTEPSDGHSIPILPDLANLEKIPEMTDPQQLAALRILMALYPPIYIAQPEMIQPLIFKMVNLALEGGHSGLAAYGYVLYGMILCSDNEGIEQGYRAGKFALSLLDQFHATTLTAKIYTLFNAHVRFWKEPLRSTLPDYLQGCQSGLETGDLEWACYNSMHYCKNIFLVGEPLILVEKKQSTYLELLTKHNHEFALSYAQIWLQMVLNLQGKSLQPEQLIGEYFDESQLLIKWESTKNYMSLFALHVVKANLFYLFQDDRAALEQSQQAAQYQQAAIGLVTTGIHNFYDSLIQLAVYSQATVEEQKLYLVAIEKNQVSLRKWAELAPQNFQHKYDLVKAEQARVCGDRWAAMDAYEQAIQGARAHEYLQEEALANELAAKFYLADGKVKIAAGYLQDAYDCYSHWGAQAKTLQLNRDYPQFSLTCAQPNGKAIDIQESLDSSFMKTISQVHTQQTHFNQNNWLDFSVVIKAAQAISQEIELEKLLITLMEIKFFHAGAERGHFVLYQNNQWVVIAQVNPEQVLLLETPLEHCLEIPQSLIYSVIRTQETAVFENLSTAIQFTSDRYILTHQPKSVLCTPISRQGKLIGILYLENNLTVGAFTRDRLEILQLLSSQSAIALENSLLYNTLEQKVAQRTADLSQTLNQLRQTQSQLIQAEKMSSLGQLVAGIAHEINNPVNFIHGNLKHITTYTQDLLDLISLYQMDVQNPSFAIVEKLEETDLEFLTTDLAAVLKSMDTGTQRIRDIVKSLRNFSRLDLLIFIQELIVR